MNKENIKCHNLGLAVKNTWEGGGGGGCVHGRHNLNLGGLSTWVAIPPPGGGRSFHPQPLLYVFQMRWDKV